ncbi:MAG TPA: hypothetical protein VEC16_00295, partial [Alphaproteobacteria bacterium]|nr:hypothetical protein [Alphaproteobacteria bacterium]
MDLEMKLRKKNVGIESYSDLPLVNFSELDDRMNNLFQKLYDANKVQNGYTSNSIIPPERRKLAAAARKIFLLNMDIIPKNPEELLSFSIKAADEPDILNKHIPSIYWRCLDYLIKKKYTNFTLDLSMSPDLNIHKN